MILIPTSQHTPVNISHVILPRETDPVKNEKLDTLMSVCMWVGIKPTHTHTPTNVTLQYMHQLFILDRISLTNITRNILPSV